jgi:hypothetical protein
MVYTVMYVVEAKLLNGVPGTDEYDIMRAASNTEMEAHL